MISATIRNPRCATFAALSLLLLPTYSFAQAGVSGSVAGVVRDSSGAVLPGVSVVAASPALIEKSREAITDGEGRYRIIDLRPGSYTITFTLSGFGLVKRDGIELSANFTATVNADLNIGSLQETLTVSGQAPTVDVQSVVQKTTVSRDELDALPIAKTFVNMASLTPAVIIAGQALQDMGNGGDRSGTMAVHGSRQSESQIDMDGMPIHNGISRGGGAFGFYINDGGTQEMMIEGGGMNAEHEIGGTRANIIPKQGGNTFIGNVFGAWTGRALQSDNLDADLQATGLKSVNTNNKLWDFNPSIGGPVVQDRLWFFSTFRNWGISNNIAGLYNNATPLAPLYTPDLSQPGIDEVYHDSASTRLTLQASSKNKFDIFYEFQYSCFCSAYSPTSLISPEAEGYYRHRPQYLIQSTWTNPVTTRVLLEAGFTLAANDYHGYHQPGVPDNVSAITNVATNFTYRASPNAYGFNRSNNYNGRASIAYVTGTHSVKTGMTFMYLWDYQTKEVNNSMSFNFNGATPVSLVEWATPVQFRETILPNIGLYAQDQWIMSHLTINYGVRYDHITGTVPAQSLGAGPFVAARNYAAVNNLPNYNDINPRLGVSWDVFGDGKTAVKASLGRYVVGLGASTLGRIANPVQASVNSVTRTWGDANGNYNPDCDLTNLQANGECGKVSDLNFGSTSKVTTAFDPNAVTGWGNRGYNWEGLVSVQREVMSGVSVSAGYSRRWYGDFLVTRNTSVTAADYNPYCIAAPTTLPGGGGNLCGFYDVTPTKFGQNNYQIGLDNAGIQDVYDGVDLSISARVHKITVSGGTSTGRERTNDCGYLNQPNLAVGILNSTTAAGLAVNQVAGTVSGFAGSAAGVSSPNLLSFCDIRPPFQTNLKFLAVYPLPWWDLQASATFQALPGAPTNSTYVGTNAQIAPSLGRNLSAGANGTVIVDLVPPNTTFTSAVNQTNFRFEKAFRINRGKIRAMVDLFNAFNTSGVISLNARVGGSYLLPTLVMPARLVKFSGSWSF